MPNQEKKFLEIITEARKHLEKKEFNNARLKYFNAMNHTTARTNIGIVWAELSWVYYYEKDYHKAIEAAENVLLQDSTYFALDDLYRVQGFAYLALGEVALAERYLQLSLEKNHDDDKQQYVKYELGKLNFAKGNYDQAHPLFVELEAFFQRFNPEYYLSILFYLGFIYYYLNNISRSEEYFKRLLSVEGVSAHWAASARFGLAFIEFRNKNHLNVIALCEEILNFNPEFFDKESLGFLTAASYFYLGRKDIFNAYYEKLSETYPRGRYAQEMENLYQSVADSDADTSDI